jgi:hypothetical protein
MSSRKDFMIKTIKDRMVRGREAEDDVNTVIQAQKFASIRKARIQTLRDLMIRGCEADDVDVISQALDLSLDESLGSNYSQKQMTEMIFDKAWSRNAPKVLEYILKHGTDVGCVKNKTKFWVTHVERGFPMTCIEIMIANGWDINSWNRSPPPDGLTNRDPPLLWEILADGDAVRWCLERGANVLLETQKVWAELDINKAPAEAATEYFDSAQYTIDKDLSHACKCPPILELAAGQSSVATFELLRSIGAPLSWRMLHVAVQARVAFGVEKDPAEEESESVYLLDQQRAKMKDSIGERMNMVRHLVDDLKLDVNARDDSPLFSHCFYGTPLDYVAYNSGVNGDCREVTMFLLGRGADPGLVTVEQHRAPAFFSVLRAWAMEQTGDSGQTYLALLETMKNQEMTVYGMRRGRTSV